MEPNHTADGTSVKPAPASIPDLNLYFLPKAADRALQGSLSSRHLERPLSKCLERAHAPESISPLL